MKKRSLLEKIKSEYLGKSFAIFCGILIVVLTISIILFVTEQGLHTFTVDKFPLLKFLFSSKWTPDADSPQFGTAIFIVGSILVSVGAVLISAPISIALAIFINFISPDIGTKVIQPALELFVGIPSVVYGWIGFSVLLPLLKIGFGGIGFSLLAGILVLSIMILPTIASLSVDAIKIIPADYVEASYSMGATRWQTISRVVLPAAKNGMLTGIILGLARAFGEALAVQMVIGNSIRFPSGLLSPTATMTSILTTDMGNTTAGSAWNDALWSLALLLLIISFLFILIIKFVSRRSEAN